MKAAGRIGEPRADLGAAHRLRLAADLGFLEAGIPVGLSVDTVELVGNADMFAIMKTIQGYRERPRRERIQADARAAMLELGTIEGARSMGIADKVGSLKPGKRADLIMVTTRAANLGVFGDPAVMLVTAAQPANVDPVMVDGRILKRYGKLAAMYVMQSRRTPPRRTPPCASARTGGSASDFGPARRRCLAGMNGAA